MRILLTGAGGMLGHDLAAAASARGAECVAPARRELDVTDAAQVEAAVRAARPQVVVNCAAWTDVDGAESTPDPALAVNGAGAGNVARAAGRLGVWTIQVSSDYVFDGAKSTPYLESDPTNPLSAYGRSKLAGECAVAREAPRDHTIVRTSWLFGAHGHCFPATIIRLAGERDQLTVVDDQVGCPTFTGHLAEALMTQCERPTAGVLHIAGGGSCSWYEFALEIVAQAGSDAAVAPARTADVPRPAPRPPRSVLRSERGAPQLPDWREGLRDYLSARAVAR